MIIITDGNEKISLKKEDTKLSERGYLIEIVNNMWFVELFIEKDKKGKWIRIVKRIPSSLEDGGDILKTYKILDNSEYNKAVLSKEDFKEIKNLYGNMQIVYEQRKETIIQAFALLFAYECYENYCLQELYSIKDSEIFSSLSLESNYHLECKRFREEIYKRANEIMKEKYNVNLNKYLCGGSKNE